MAGQNLQIVDGTRLGEYFRDHVRRAILQESLDVSEYTEFYVVDLLTRFERTERLFTPQNDGYDDEPLALMYARAISGDAATQVKELKKLGDRALYVAGFFNEHIKKGPVSVNYYIDMGSSAYSALSGRLVSEELFSKLYSELAENFSGLAKALHSLSIADHTATNLDLLHLYDRYLRTGDEKLLETLAKEGIVPAKKPVNC